VCVYTHASKGARKYAVDMLFCIKLILSIKSDMSLLLNLDEAALLCGSMALSV